jgi:hypothetical protein
MGTKRKPQPPKLRPLSPLQAQKQLQALERLYNTEDVNIMTSEAYDRLRREILMRVVQ